MKRQTSNSEITQVVVLGVVAGMRSMLAPALFSRVVGKSHGLPGQSKLWQMFASPVAAKAFSVMSAGEVVADKLPGVPSRIAPGPLAGRALSGALIGGAVFSQARKPLVAGLLLGGVAAIAGAYGGYHLRRLTADKLHLPDSVVAFTEDALAMKLGTSVL